MARSTAAFALTHGVAGQHVARSCRCLRHMDKQPDAKVLALRYPGICRLCGGDLPARTRAVYERAARRVRCIECPPTKATSTPPIESDVGRAGESARREYERRRARDEERTRGRWGPLGGIAVALMPERATTANWARGAAGEERLGTLLDDLPPDSTAVLHDRRVPGSRANIDHIVVTTGGVWVIDAKRYRDGGPQLRVEGGLFRPRVEKLYVGGRIRTHLVDGVLRQVDLVRDEVGDVPVRGALCFVDAVWPLIGGDFMTRGVNVLWPKRLATSIAQDQGRVDVAAVAEILARRFKAA